MNKISALLLFSILFFMFPPVFSQSENETTPSVNEVFQPDAKSVGLGGSLVVQARNPSAIFWNPALLTSLKDRSVLLSVDKPFEFALAAITQFVPLYGTFGFALSRIPTTEGNLDRGTFGWGRHFSKWLAIGGNMNFQRRNSKWFSSATVGVHVGNSRAGTLGEPWQNYTNSDFLDKFSFGVAIQDLPFSEKVQEPSALFGLSYLIPRARLLLNSGYHINNGENTTHVGLGVAVSDQLTVFSGLEDFEFDRLGFGVGYTLDNFIINTSYSAKFEQLFVTVSARIGASPASMARPHFNKGANSLKDGKYDKASRELKKYLSYQLHNDKSDSARVLVNVLDREVKRTRFQVDSLHTVAMSYLKQPSPQFLRAALFLTKILELDPNNESAKAKLATLKPFVDDLINNSLEDGVFQFEGKNYEQAEKIFRRVLFFDKHHETALYYLDEIEQAFHELAEEHLYRGIGFYLQKNYDLALKEFKNAVEKNAKLDEAHSYLKRTEQKIQEQKSELETLLAEGRELESKGQYSEATNRYLGVLKLDKNNQTAKYRLTVLRPRVERLVQNKYNEGLRYYREENYILAEEVLVSVISLDPDHTEARRLLSKIRGDRKGKVASSLAEADQAFQKKQWQEALDLYGKVLALEPGNNAAKQGRAETLKQIEITDLIAHARQADTNKEYKQAVELYGEVLQLDPENQVAQEELQEARQLLQAKIEAIFNEGINSFTLDKYQEAMAKWQQVLQLDPDHQGALDYKKQTEERIEALKSLQQ